MKESDEINYWFERCEKADKRVSELEQKLETMTKDRDGFKHYYKMWLEEGKRRAEKIKFLIEYSGTNHPEYIEEMEKRYKEIVEEFEDD